MAEDRQHQALYRRYRPQTPAEVLGQDHVVRALTGAIRDGRLHHAFLFCGPRGTGKTSTARILAKMVNCATGPTAEPCGGCDQCVAIREGTHLDVVEIDAASHGGVEDARELREKAPTAPVQGREKVYIIDEAQRLSREAFDALLKVFEEPPPGVRFVLATTEPHKMPATIVGRCQRFDFRRHTMEGLSELLQKVAASEGVTLDDSAAHAIARHAEGSARDALSLLDQAGVLGGQKVDDAAIQALLGAPRSEVQVELADAVAVGDARKRVRGRQSARPGRAGSPQRHQRDARALPRPVAREDGAGAGGPPRHPGRRVRRTADPGREVHGLRARAGDRPVARGAERHAMDHVAAAVAGARLGAGHDPGDGSVARRHAVAAGTARAPRQRRAGHDRAVRRRRFGRGRPRRGPNAGRRDRSPTASAVAETATPASRSLRDSLRPPRRRPPASRSPPRRPRRPPTAPEAADAPHAASAGSVDVTMLRRSWPSLLDHLSQVGQPVLRALLESATPASFDGETLELAFPPSFRNNLRQVASARRQSAGRPRRPLRDPSPDRERDAGGACRRDGARGRRRRRGGRGTQRGGGPEAPQGRARRHPGRRPGSRRGLTPCTRARSRS